MYLIDKLALRAGNEKGEDEADTVGCCSLRLEHVTLLPKDEENPVDRIALSFLGKDSILYEQVVEVDAQVFKNIKIFKSEPKTQEDDLFDRLTVCPFGTALNTGLKFLVADVFAQQTSGKLHARPYCQGVPYLQRFVDVPRTTRTHTQGRHGSREDRCV
jgi:DNA topoisomerase-1